jgi:HPt (histidine-containing phosphotransfer) domain-containing protein
MQKSASNKEEAAFRREAHAIRGGAGMVGAVEVQSLAAAMEENGVDANHVVSLDGLAVACNRLRRILMTRFIM